MEGLLSAITRGLLPSVSLPPPLAVERLRKVRLARKKPACLVYQFLRHRLQDNPRPVLCNGNPRPRPNAERSPHLGGNDKLPLGAYGSDLTLHGLHYTTSKNESPNL